MGLCLYLALHSFIPHSQFSESSNSKMRLLFPDETIWDQDTFSHQESISCRVNIHVIINDIHTKSHLLIVLPLIKKRAISGQCSFNCILLETQKLLRLIYSHPCKKPAHISGLTHLSSKTNPIFSEASKNSGHYSKLHRAACCKLQRQVWVVFAFYLPMLWAEMNLNPYLHIKSFSPAHAVSYKIPFIIFYNLLIQLTLTCKLCLPTSPYGHCVLADVAMCQVCRSGKDIFPQQTVNSGSYHLEICWCLSPSYSQLIDFCRAHWGGLGISYACAS